ncbi:hypothetical protein [Enterocloster lavalensis]|uniref:hypothetical protein n=1 Tax=Enterocloster lavalensis TaxID=460384 RepID=UPI001D068A34|nr:hypothetical protein [Enterocloster lavalensis]MCB6343759.1 hypothetical protein [Enterocloster lavalensis]
MTIPEILLAILVLALFFLGLAAMVIFPIAAVVLTVVFVVRRKKGGLKLMWVPGLLLLISLAAWNLDNLFVNGPGYYFHHDPGSKVYNEGYIIPHYEDMYGESLELVEKEVIDSCNAVYTLKSGLTGDTFTAESRYYDTCSGSFDMLHLTENYGEILGKRLAGGETVSLPFDEGYSVKMPDGKYAWFMIFKSRDGYRFTIDAEKKRREEAFDQPVSGDRFSLDMEAGGLVLKVALLDGSVAEHWIFKN